MPKSKLTFDEWSESMRTWLYRVLVAKGVRDDEASGLSLEVAAALFWAREAEFEGDTPE